MASTKPKSTRAKAKQSPLPERFADLEQAADFWDTHDSADYEEHMTDIGCEISIEKRLYLIPLAGDLFKKVNAIAQKKGVPAERLVNDWIEEKAS